MRVEEDESAPRTASAGKTKKKKRKHHNHIGPNVRAFRAGLAFCPVCISERAHRPADEERQGEKESRKTPRDFRRS